MLPATGGGTPTAQFSNLVNNLKTKTYQIYYDNTASNILNIGARSISYASRLTYIPYFYIISRNSNGVYSVFYLNISGNNFIIYDNSAANGPYTAKTDNFIQIQINSAIPNGNAGSRSLEPNIYINSTVPTTRIYTGMDASTSGTLIASLPITLLRDMPTMFRGTPFISRLRAPTAAASALTLFGGNRNLKHKFNKTRKSSSRV